MTSSGAHPCLSLRLNDCLSMLNLSHICLVVSDSPKTRCAGFLLRPGSLIALSTLQPKSSLAAITPLASPAFLSSSDMGTSFLPYTTVLVTRRFACCCIGVAHLQLAGS